MSEQESKSPPKDERAEQNERQRKSPEYRRFKQLLKQVVKAPPLKRSIVQSPKTHD